jgi:hypothetical protein
VLLAGFFLGSLFDPEDGGDMFLQNVGLLSPDLCGIASQKIERFQVYFHF